LKSISDNKLILTLAIPAILQTVIRSSFSIVDAFWVGKLGSIELASLTVATFLVWGALALGELISIGTNSLIAQSVGANNISLAKRISARNIFNTFFHSIVIGLLIIPALPFLYEIINLDQENSYLTGQYLLTILIGLPCITLLSTVSAIFRGNGDTKTPFYLLFISVVLNFFLTPILIFGIELSDGSLILNYGLRGAALSTLISYLISFFIGFIVLKKKGYTDPVIKYKFDKEILKETVRIGLPISLNGMAFSLIYVFVSRFVAEFGTVGLAALGIGHRCEAIAYHASVGFSLAATILVGQNMGAGNPKRAEKFAWRVTGIGAFALFLYSIPLFIFSSEIAAIFVSDPEVIAAASIYNKLNAAVMIFAAAEVTLSGAFAGAGDSTPPSVTGLVVNFMRIPMAFIFSQIWGLDGIWLAIAASVLIKGIVISAWFKKGNWKKKVSKLVKKQDNIMELTRVE
jgi:putative MATE family efflux protein